jgi:hypothetical protein
MINLTRPAIIYPFILIVNILFASYFLDLTLNPLSAPQPYRSLLLLLFFFGCTVILSIYSVNQSNTLSTQEKESLQLKMILAEAALALVWWIGVLLYTPPSGDSGGGGRTVEWWTQGRAWMMSIAIFASIVLLGAIGERRKCI